MASEMLSVTAPYFTDPSAYQTSTLPRPVVAEATDVVFRVHAASINPVDVKKAAGVFKLAVKEGFPYQIGYDCAGVVTDVGKEVKDIKVGDEVYTRLPEASRGESMERVRQMPTRICRSQAKEPLFWRRCVVAVGGDDRHAVSGTGSYACQVAKNVFGAGKVITTVSTAKMDKVPELLGLSTVDQVIDYTKQDPKTVIPSRSVDFVLDTTGEAMAYLHLMVPSTGLIVSISTQPSGAQLQQSSVMRRPDNPRLPWYGCMVLNALDTYRRARARRWGVAYEYLFLDPNATDLATLSQYVEEGKVVPVVGTRVNIRDIDQVREACGMVYRGKGGVGKTVIEVVPT
ncbi:hypothetical protein ACJZ2D_000555 [Fusarium nematophilum]